MKKVFGLGACVLDTLINCDGYPVEDTKQKANGVFRTGGGPVGNALVVMSELGVKAEVIGNFADDGASEYLIDDFTEYGVGTKYVNRVKNTASFTSYILLNSTKSSRTCVFDRGTVPDDAELIDTAVLKDAELLHLDGNYLNCAIKCAEFCKENGIKVSLDAGGLYNGIEKLLPYVDLLIPSAEFALGITGQKDIFVAMEKLKAAYNPEVLVVTNGADGSYFYNNGKIEKVNSYPVKAVDTNGAGDTYHGAFIAAYLHGKGVKECCEFASAVSAYKCTQRGVRTFELNEEIIGDFLEKQGEAYGERICGRNLKIYQSRREK